MADYIEKIKNLLALAESTNEHEARSALLKARELMAKHKILENDLKDAGGQEVERRVTDVTYSIRRDPWVNNLGGIIAKHHCCRSFQSRVKGKQTAEMGFVGFTDDITICMEIFKYAVDCIRSVTKKYRKTKGVKSADGYGYGFVAGLIEAYEKQQKEEGWGLVLVVPKEVDTVVEGMSTRKFSYNKKIEESDIRAFHKGMRDGREFDMAKRLK